MDFDDERWSQLLGGYRIPYDPRSALRALETETGADLAQTWSDLWENLHHQGDVGEASYAALPAIANLVIGRGVTDWNPFALAAVIEEARYENARNPPLPSWLERDYANAWTKLFEAALKLLPRATDASEISSLLAVLALHQGQRFLSRMALLNEQERSNMLDEVGWA
jgi:hypothetical protein